MTNHQKLQSSRAKTQYLPLKTEEIRLFSSYAVALRRPHASAYSAGLLGAITCLAAVLGCGKSEPTNPVSSQALAKVGEFSPTLASDVPGLTEVSPPEEVLKRFLEAIQTGDDRIATALLTEKARSETRRNDLILEPKGSATARFRVGKAEVVTLQGDGAHVESVWTDLNHQGRAIDYRFTWIMRRERSGWRVAGMATEQPGGREPLVLNFENPGEMLAKRDAARSEIAKRQPSEGGPLREARRIDALPNRTQK